MGPVAVATGDAALEFNRPPSAAASAKFTPRHAAMAKRSCCNLARLMRVPGLWGLWGISRETDPRKTIAGPGPRHTRIRWTAVSPRAPRTSRGSLTFPQPQGVGRFPRCCPTFAGWVYARLVT
jgi:hypothetical protein